MVIQDKSKPICSESPFLHNLRPHLLIGIFACHYKQIDVKFYIVFSTPIEMTLPTYYNVLGPI